MSEMRFPLKEHLQDPVDEAAIHRVGLEVDARLEGSWRRRALPLALVSAAAAAAILVLVWSNIRRSPGPLLLADGRDIVAMAAADVGSEIDLSDGSRIRLSPGARLEPLESTGAKFSAIVTQGHADFDVRPGGSRHWTIECGLATVEVIGTAFTCEREPGRLRVVVRHGAVLVRGDHVPERARRLSAGESLEILDRGSMAAPAAPPAASRAGEGNPHAASLVEPPSAAAPKPEAASTDGHAASGKSWRYLARHGRHGEAFAALGSDGLRRESERLGVSDLLALADVARLSGHPAQAVMPLERIVSEFSSDSQAPLAAFALGRLELDSLGQARAAVMAFRKALDLGIPRGLREDVLARLVEAYARSGEAGPARRAAQAYRDEFPNGRYARAIEGWLQSR